MTIRFEEPDKVTADNLVKVEVAGKSHLHGAKITLRPLEAEHRYAYEAQVHDLVRIDDDGKGWLTPVLRKFETAGEVTLTPEEVLTLRSPSKTSDCWDYLFIQAQPKP